MLDDVEKPLMENDRRTAEEFDPSSPALAFAYSGALHDGRPRELLSSPENVTPWLMTYFPHISELASDQDLEDALALRTAIARAAVAISRGARPVPDDVDVINLFAATPDIPPLLEGGARQAGRRRMRPSHALSALAREAVGLFQPSNAYRIRECDADDCHLIFYDDSRSNNRRWCSMQRCGNRAKVRKHRRRIQP